MQWLEDLWGWLLGVVGAAAIGLAGSHAKLRDRVARLEIELHPANKTLGETAEKVDRTHDAVIRMESSAQLERARSHQTNKKLDEILEATKRKR